MGDRGKRPLDRETRISAHVCEPGTGSGSSPRGHRKTLVLARPDFGLGPILVVAPEDQRRKAKGDPGSK
jgi:hypothetical protein